MGDRTANPSRPSIWASNGGRSSPLVPKCGPESGRFGQFCGQDRVVDCPDSSRASAPSTVNRSALAYTTAIPSFSESSYAAGRDRHEG